MWDPVVSPRTQQTQAHLTTGIEVGVEAHLTMPRGLQEALGGPLRVVIAEVHVVEEGPMSVGRTTCPHYERTHDIDPLPIVAEEDGVGGLAGE